jgi:predicted carbohydrate-binding protein with CBM5 and CBM33 domain
MADDLGLPTVTQIGTTVGNLADTKVAPVANYLPATATRGTVCGAQVAADGPRIIWKYPDRKLTGEQYYQLKNLVGENLSADVVIKTPTQQVSTSTYEPVIATYNATMLWPAQGVDLVYKNMWTIPDDGIIFINLSEAS